MLMNYYKVTWNYNLEYLKIWLAAIYLCIILILKYSVYIFFKDGKEIRNI